MKTELTLRLEKGAEKPLLKGFPWLFRGQFVESSEQLFVEPGALCDVVTTRGEFVGIGYFNAKSDISCRLLTTLKDVIDEAWVERRLQNALARRSKFKEPYYRLVHSESDGLPGLLIDRFDDQFTIQCGTAGMERLLPLIVSALEKIFSPRTLILRNDTRARLNEGLTLEKKILKGDYTAPTEVHENSCVYVTDLLEAQKTGWYFDQRDNRALVAAHASGKSVLDVFSNAGGFGLLAAKSGATEVTLVDGSAQALEWATQAANLNNLRNLQTLKGDAFELMAAHDKQYDIVVADPPAFVKTKKDIATGMKGYTKVARLSAALVAPGGVLFIAACSHHATPERFANAVKEGLKQAGREGEILKRTGAAPDHPVHPALPQSAYLKGLLIKLA